MKRKVESISNKRYASDENIIQAEERKGETLFSYADEKWLLLAKFEFYKIRLVKTRYILHSKANCIGLVPLAILAGVLGERSTESTAKKSAKCASEVRILPIFNSRYFTLRVPVDTLSIHEGHSVQKQILSLSAPKENWANPGKIMTI